MTKTAQSSAEFKNTRVTTGKAVLVKGGKAIALSFVNKRPEDPTKNKSSETTSFS